MSSLISGPKIFIYNETIIINFAETESVSFQSMVFLTRQVDGSPADLVRERSKDDVPDQKPGEEQRSS